jgi:Ca-activated chloride channel family protein
MRTTILLDHEPTPAGPVIRALLKLEGDVIPSDDRRPLDICLVLDRSGSMGGEKLAAARSAAAQLVRRLAPSDVASVVAFDQEVSVIAEPATGGQQADLAQRIERIASGGSTNLSGGWLRGREFVARGLGTPGVHRIMLLTDGQANVGIQDPDTLVGMCTQARAQGISTTTIGFGADYDEHLLRAMAEAGGGNTFYIESADQASAIFNDELEGLFGLSAQNLTVSVAPAPSVTLAAVHHDYPRTSDANGVARLDLGDLYAREPRALLCEFLVSDIAGQDDVAVATLIVTADVITPEGIEHRTIELPITVSLADGPSVNAEVQRELLLLQSARARMDALRAQQEGDFSGAHARLASMGAQLRASPFALEELVAEDAADLELMAMRVGEAPASAADLKYMHQRSYNRRSARSMKDELIRRMQTPPQPAPHPDPDTTA